jgi:plastocyanin
MKRMKLRFVSIVIMTAAILLATGARHVVAAGDTAVKIDNFSFGPSSVTVPVGTTLTWTNRDDVPHVVASVDNLFKSKALDTDDHFSFTFTKPGTYEYFCAIHPKMTAKIVVQ